MKKFNPQKNCKLFNFWYFFTRKNNEFYDLADSPNFSTSNILSIRKVFYLFGQYFVHLVIFCPSDQMGWDLLSFEILLDSKSIQIFRLILRFEFWRRFWKLSWKTQTSTKRRFMVPNWMMHKFVGTQNIKNCFNKIALMKLMFK